jgi:hypothetical protein
MYEEELQQLTAELKAAQEERSRLEAEWREKYMPDVEELIEFGGRRKHAWAKHWGELAREALLNVLYAATDERSQILTLDYEIKRLKPRVRRAKKMVRFTRGER